MSLSPSPMPAIIKRTPLAEYRRAGARRQRPFGHGDARGRFRHQPVCGVHPCAAAVLLLHRHGLQAEGLAAAGSAHRGQGQGDGQSAAAGGRRAHHHHPAAAGRRSRSGTSCNVVFATKSGDVRRNQLSDFVQVQQERQDRHEATKPATASSACSSAPIRTTCC